jgi:hypothetical protein
MIYLTPRTSSLPVIASFITIEIAPSETLVAVQWEDRWLKSIVSREYESSVRQTPYEVHNRSRRKLDSFVVENRRL